MRRIFLDANVLFTAAHNPAGKAAFLIELGKGGHWLLMTSALAVEEARRNLMLKFPHAVKNLESMLDGIPVMASVSGKSCPIDLPAKDRPIFLTAKAGGATHLLTGDLRHFGSFMDNPTCSDGIVITTVGTFLENI